MGAGEGRTSESSSDDGEIGHCQSLVVLNVYDLTPVNHYTHWFGFGIFHSGIEVHGMEYGFGAHELPFSGVFEVEPRSCPGFIYRCSISLGQINMPHSEFRTFIEGVASEYHGDTYHLIRKNCNHFTDDVAWRLTKKHIPGWVNRLAHLGSVCSCLLPESLQLTTVQELPEHDDHMGEGSESSSEDGDHNLHLLEHSESDETDRDMLLPAASNSANGDVAFIKELNSVTILVEVEGFDEEYTSRGVGWRSIVQL